MITTDSTIVPRFKVVVYQNRTTSITQNELLSIMPWLALQDKFISISVTEKFNECPVCQLKLLYDDSLDMLFNISTVVHVEWGLEQEPLSILFTSPGEVSGIFLRKMDFMVRSKSVRLENGVAYINLGMMGFPIPASVPKYKTYISGTKSSMIYDIANLMNIDPLNVFMDFSEQFDTLTKQTPMVLDCSPVQFLYRLAAQWNKAIFYQNNPETKAMSLYVLDWSSSMLQQTFLNRGLKGNYHLFDYGTSTSNIMDGDISMNNNLAFGSNSFLSVGPNGQPMLTVVNGEDEPVATYELNQAKVEAAIKERGFTDGLAYVTDVLKASAGTPEYQALIDKYFDKKMTTTAPEGPGYVAKFKVIPNPLYQIGDMAVLGSSTSPMPIRFKTQYVAGIPQPGSMWRINELTQTITASSYDVDIELGIQSGARALFQQIDFFNAKV